MSHTTTFERKKITNIGSIWGDYIPCYGESFGTEFTHHILLRDHDSLGLLVSELLYPFHQYIALVH